MKKVAQTYWTLFILLLASGKGLAMTDSVLVQLLSEYRQLNSKVDSVVYEKKIFSYYLNVGEFENAKIYLNRGLSNARIIENDTLYARLLNNKSAYFIRINALDSARIFANQSISVKRQLGDSIGITKSRFNLAVSYKLDGQFELARVEYYEILKTQYKFDITSVNRTLNNIGSLYYKQLNYDSAEVYFLKSLDESIKIDAFIEQSRVHSNLEGLYKRIGNYEKQIQHIRAFYDVEDKIFKQENQIRIADLEAKFLAEKQAKQIAEKEKQLTQKKFTLWIMILSISMLVVAVIFLLLRHKKQVQLLEAQSKFLETQKKLLTSMKLGALKYIKGQEDERRRIAYGLHTKLNHNFMAVLLSEEKQQYIDQARTDLNEAASEIFSHSIADFGIKGAVREYIYKKAEEGKELQFTAFKEDWRFEPYIEATIARITIAIIDAAFQQGQKDFHLYLLLENKKADHIKTGDAELDKIIGGGKEDCRFEIALLTEGYHFNYTELSLIAASLLSSLEAEVESKNEIFTVRIRFEDIKIGKTKML